MIQASDLRQCASLFNDYTELRVQQNRSVEIALVNGDVMRNARSVTGGSSARVGGCGAWGFASAPEVGTKTFERIVERASRNASVLKMGKNLERELPETRTEGAFDYATEKERMGQKELLDFARSLDAYILKNFPDLQSRVVVLRNLDMEKSLLTSQGAEAYSMTPRSLIYVDMTMMSEGEPVNLFEGYGGLGQFEDQFGAPEDLFDKLQSQYEHLVKKAKGVYAEAGPKECILDADLAGILAHEAIGHTTEADFVMGGSVAAHYMDQEVASPLVNLVDFAHHALGETCPIPVHVDDEGTPAEDVTIIEEGVLKSYMHNKESAAHFETGPKGNARAFLFSDEPLIRMRNTAILPGESKLEDMIASIDDGYYLMRPGNGQADTTSEFMFAVVQGYEIKKGKLGRAIKDTTISGVAFDLLKTVTALSDEMKWVATGMCGKKQPIPVGMGGPAIKCTVNMGGR
ncbi:MAG TPA: TldD/PmbA family protein [Planctomycetes bacterium]|nr:TldD/PmbA family protein [Planctomycetota bacterium]